MDNSIILNQSPINKLNTGLLFLDFERLASEPGYEAIGRITYGYYVVQRRYQYSHDLIRALTEAKLTTKLKALVEVGISIEEKTFEPEELITYYDGIFLDYIHQIKDKTLRLIWWMMQDSKTKSKPKEPEGIRLRSLSPYDPVLKKIGIDDLLHEWDQESASNVAVALKKRTQHHHFVSNLQLNSDFQKIKMSKSMLAPNSINMLSEYGKTRMQQIGEESYKKWKEDIENKHAKTLEVVEKNLNDIAIKLIEYYKIPVDPKEYAEVVNKYTEVQKRFDIKNKAATTNISQDLKSLIDQFVSFNKEFFANHLVSIYLVGSVPRGEFVPGASNINMIVITDVGSYEDFPENVDPILNVRFMSEKVFLSDEMKKHRFICWSDGVLLYGKEFNFNEKEFPKPGTLLALLLNRGFIEKLEEIKDKVIQLNSNDKKKLRYFSLMAIRIMLDFGFGAAMSNKPYYTASRKEKIDYIKESFPSARRQTETFEKIYHGGVVRQQDFPLLIDTFLENGRKNYKRMLDVEAEILKEESNPSQ